MHVCSQTVHPLVPNEPRNLAVLPSTPFTIQFPSPAPVKTF